MLLFAKREMRKVAVCLFLIWLAILQDSSADSHHRSHSPPPKGHSSRESKRPAPPTPAPEFLCSELDELDKKYQTRKLSVEGKVGHEALLLLHVGNYNTLRYDSDQPCPLDPNERIVVYKRKKQNSTWVAARLDHEATRARVKERLPFFLGGQKGQIISHGRVDEHQHEGVHFFLVEIHNTHQKEGADRVNEVICLFMKHLYEENPSYKWDEQKERDDQKDEQQSKNPFEGLDIPIYFGSQCIDEWGKETWVDEYPRFPILTCVDWFPKKKGNATKPVNKHNPIIRYMDKVTEENGGGWQEALLIAPISEDKLDELEKALEEAIHKAGHSAAVKLDKFTEPASVRVRIDDEKGPTGMHYLDWGDMVVTVILRRLLDADLHSELIKTPLLPEENEDEEVPTEKLPQILRSDDAPDLYALLNVEPSASDDEIEKAYRQAALKWHPDRLPADVKSGEEKAAKRKQANEKFGWLSTAVEVFRNKKMRKAYDLITKRKDRSALGFFCHYGGLAITAPPPHSSSPPPRRN